jgi:tRNA(Ile)-lysidine synthase
LTILCAKLAKEFGFNLVALTVDHKIRVESSKEASFIHEIMQTMQIEHHILTIKNKIEYDSGNIQALARKARYQALTEFCNQHNIHYLLTAHTLNDQIENFFIRLARGAGLNGLKGISPSIKMDKINVIRPLLSFSKKELREFLKDNNFTWVEDPSNID